MPYIKPLEVPYAKVSRLLRGYGLNGPKLSSILDCSPVTARSRLKNPETLTLAELENISRAGHIPKEELLDAVSGGMK